MNLKGLGSYVPPPYIPLANSDHELEAATAENSNLPASASSSDVPVQWSSGICACCDDTPSCVIGLFCPCYLFAKNAEFLGSGTLLGPCMTHFMLWALLNSVCCLLTDGVLLGLPGCFISCYACNYRKNLRIKYNLPEAPCGDFVTHFFCHQCAVCQEYREICERSDDPNYADLSIHAVTAPPIQKMQPHPGE
ncbi:protein PLANT CADMIUM RESISTANCE 10 [Amaranthus tricolor]|uniref:protein PLANT CADMIUM RESISTANCE 10 n=1 Tax=Amaranthus tricolor TaxID=29722 RepID=UPI0025901A91|nr:protein PLANT CADMIUM RESISTANCE 10 [Amaranthus tricolor]